VLHQVISVEALERVVDEFLAEQPPTGLAVVISLDGKTLRGTIPPGESCGIHLLAGYLPQGRRGLAPGASRPQRREA
jgi:hypothetical protein